MTIIINPPLPWWVRFGQPRPPLWMKQYFPEQWEEELLKYGAPEEVGKYFTEETMKRIREKLKISEIIGNASTT